MNTIAGTRSVLVPNLIHVKNGDGKMSVPVQPYIARYVQFRHIVGVPTKGGTSNVSVSKLVALDNLIDKLINKKAATVNARENSKSVNQKADQIISSLENQYINHLITGKISTSSAATGMGIFLDTWA